MFGFWIRQVMTSDVDDMREIASSNTSNCVQLLVKVGYYALLLSLLLSLPLSLDVLLLLCLFLSLLRSLSLHLSLLFCVSERLRSIYSFPENKFQTFGIRFNLDEISLHVEKISIDIDGISPCIRGISANFDGIDPKRRGLLFI